MYIYIHTQSYKIKCPETMSLELFKLKISKRIHIILHEFSMYKYHPKQIYL